MPCRTTLQTSAAALYPRRVRTGNPPIREFSRPATPDVLPLPEPAAGSSEFPWLRPESHSPGWMETRPPQATSASAALPRLLRTSVRTCRTREHVPETVPVALPPTSAPERPTGASRTHCTPYQSWFDQASHHLPVGASYEA